MESNFACGQGTLGPVQEHTKRWERILNCKTYDQEDFSQWRGCPTDLWANLGSLESGEGGEEEGAFESPIGSWLVWI